MKIRSLIAALLVATYAPFASAQGLPDLGDASSASLSSNDEKVIGDRIMREVRVDSDFIDDPEIADYINSLGQRLLDAADGPHPNIDFFVLRDDTINAFALVGGHIGVHSGLITLTQNESELAGVVGHEIGHILQHHQARMMHDQRGIQLASLAALALGVLASRGNSSQSGQVTEAAVAAAGAAQLQSQLNYSRENEREADRVGLQLLNRAGFAPSAMVDFFQRLLQANRLNEFKGAPAYLRDHPLTTERIADMQDRVAQMPSRLVADTFEYRLVRAKLRAQNGSPMEALVYFKSRLEDTTVVRPRDDVFGLALAQRRTRDFEGAWKTLEPLRQGASHPDFEHLAGELQADMGHDDQAVAIYQAALKSYPDQRAIVYSYLDLLQQMGRTKDVLADVETRLRNRPDDARLYEIQARAYEAVGKTLAQHRSQAEAQYRRGNLAAAVDQLQIAVKAKSTDFYEQSSAESRLREMKALLETQRAAEKALKIS